MSSYKNTEHIPQTSFKVRCEYKGKESSREKKLGVMIM